MGKGYVHTPVRPLEDYDDLTKNTFSIWFSNEDLISGRNWRSLTPVYPMFVALIYWMFGIDPDHVLLFQVVMIGITGGMLVLAGNAIWPRFGAFLGCVAAFLLAMDRDSSYPTYQLLTETMATFFITLMFLLATLTQSKSARWQLLVGVACSMAILTRPALIFVGILYGVSHLLAGRRGVKHACYFALPCTMFIGIWSAICTYHEGRLVILADQSSEVVVHGLRGLSGVEREAARLAGKPIDFDPHATSVTQEFGKAVANPIELGQTMAKKVRMTLERRPIFFWNATLLGATLLSLPWTTFGARDKTETLPFYWFIAGGAAFLGISAMGFSHPTFNLFFILGAILIPIWSWYGRKGGGQQPALWVLAWPFGLLAIPVLTIGLSRYIRPFVPVFYLLGLIGLILLIMAFQKMALTSNTPSEKT